MSVYHEGPVDKAEFTGFSWTGMKATRSFPKTPPPPPLPAAARRSPPELRRKIAAATATGLLWGLAAILAGLVPFRSAPHSEASLPNLIVELSPGAPESRRPRTEAASQGSRAQPNSVGPRGEGEIPAARGARAAEKPEAAAPGEKNQDSAFATSPSPRQKAPPSPGTTRWTDAEEATPAMISVQEQQNERSGVEEGVPSPVPPPPDAGYRDGGPETATAAGSPDAGPAAEDAASGGLEIDPAALALLKAAIREQLRYPPAAWKRSISGTVKLEIAVDSSGTLLECSVVASSGSEMLDTAAVSLMRNLFRTSWDLGGAFRTRISIEYRLN